MKPVNPVLKKSSGRTEAAGLSKVVFAANQPEYISLPAIFSRCEEGMVTTRWKLTWRERLKLFVTGDLYIQMLTFRKSLMPIPRVDEPPIEECL